MALFMVRGIKSVQGVQNVQNVVCFGMRRCRFAAL